MKNIVVLLLIASSLLVGCDRDTLNGLNVKVQGELNTDYKDQEDEEVKSENQNNSSSSNSKVTENNPSSQPESKNVEDKTPEAFENKPVKEVKNESNVDPDAPLAFLPQKDCSEAGIRKKTNKAFYSKNEQVKSIDSKNKEQVKEWKSIYNQMKEKCKTNKN